MIDRFIREKYCYAHVVVCHARAKSETLLPFLWRMTMFISFVLRNVQQLSMDNHAESNTVKVENVVKIQQCSKPIGQWCLDRPVNIWSNRGTDEIIMLLLLWFIHANIKRSYRTRCLLLSESTCFIHHSPLLKREAWDVQVFNRTSYRSHTSRAACSNKVFVRALFGKRVKLDDVLPDYTRFRVQRAYWHKRTKSCRQIKWTYVLLIAIIRQVIVTVGLDFMCNVK